MSKGQLFLFDYEKFTSYIRPYLTKAQNGQYFEVIQHAQQLAQQKKFTEKWILEGVGTSTKGFTDIDVKKLDEPELAHQTGFSLLVLFSQFLEWLSLPTTFKHSGMYHVVQIGKQFGWKQTDLKHFEFMNYPTLLGYEDYDYYKTTDAQWRNPQFFWFWFRPENCFTSGSGWWSTEQIRQIHKLLLNTEIQFAKVKIERLKPSFPIYELDIRIDFALLETLLSYAIDYKKSLYFVSYP